MSRDNTWYYWEAEQAAAAQAPTTAPMTPSGAGAPGQEAGVDQQQQQIQQPSKAKTEDPNKKPDISKDPQHPDMSGAEQEDKDFEEWKNDYFQLAIKGDTVELIHSLKKMTHKELDPTQHKFIWDNSQIQLFREDANIEKASREIRKLMKDNLDENYPATTTMQHVSETLEKFPMLKDVFFKLLGRGGAKGDEHRKFLGGLLCAVQTGGGGSREDLVYSEKEFSINYSTRFSSEWGEVNLGKWALKADDPERYLEEPELARLKDGSPEERTVLRHRVVLSSIAEQFKQRAFLIHVVNPGGTIHALGWDVGDSIKSGYVDGHLVVRTKSGDSTEAMINDDGQIIPITDLVVKFQKDSGRQDDSGRPIKREYPFLERINGTLYFTATVNTIRAMSDSMSGVFFKEVPYNGNPSDIRELIRSVPAVADMLLMKRL